MMISFIMVKITIIIRKVTIMVITYVVITRSLLVLVHVNIAILGDFIISLMFIVFILITTIIVIVILIVIGISQVIAFGNKKRAGEGREGPHTTHNYL